VLFGKWRESEAPNPFSLRRETRWKRFRTSRERAIISRQGLLQPEHLNRAKREEEVMPESVYKVIELVGTSTESWEKAAKAAVDRAAKSLRDLRVAEVVQQDMQLKDGKVEAYRAKVKISFKFEGKG
jgi:flavin-binding protein dodecin